MTAPPRWRPGNPEALAPAAVNDGANLVIASGPYVLRGMQFNKGDLIDYSMGNFAGYGNFATGGDLSLSGILRGDPGGAGRCRILPLSPTGSLAAALSRLRRRSHGCSFWARRGWP